MIQLGVIVVFKTLQHVICDFQHEIIFSLVILQLLFKYIAIIQYLSLR